MKKLFFFISLGILLSFQANNLLGQKRPVRKTVTTGSKTKVIETPKEESVNTKEEPAKIVEPIKSDPAQEFFNQGLKCDATDYDCQISNYTKAINLNLNTKEVFKNRGNAYLAREDYEKAIADLTKVINLDLNDANSYKSRGIAIYNMAESDKELDKSIADFTTAIELEPKDAQAYKYRGIAYFTRANFEKANADFEKSLSLNPKDTDIYSNQAEAYTESRNYDKAVELLTKAISLKPSDTELYSKRAFIYVRQKKYDFALNDFTKIAELNPKKEGVNGIRGEIFLENKKYDEAINAFTKEIALQNKQQAYYYFQRGKVYRLLKKNNEALADFTSVIELNPQFAEAYEERGEIFNENKNYEKAIEDSTKSININPKSKKAYLIRGSSLYYKNGATDLQSQQDFKKHNAIVLETSNRIIQTDPQNISAYLDRAQIYFSTQQYSLAMADYTKVIELDPKNYKAFYMRGLFRSIVYSASDRFKANPLEPEPLESVQQSIQDLTKAIEIEPDKDEAYSLRASRYYYLAYVNKVDILNNRNNAIYDYAKVIKLNPKNVSAYKSLSDFAVELKKFDGALSALNDAVNANPENPEAYLYRALFFQYTMKDKNKAVADYEKCTQLNIETNQIYAIYKKSCSDKLAELKK